MTEDDQRKLAHQLAMRLDEQWEIADEVVRVPGFSVATLAEILGQIRAYRVTLDLLWHVSGHTFGRMMDPADARLVELRHRVYREDDQ